jgi:hypothetical protein
MHAPPDTDGRHARLGPLLYFRGVTSGRVSLAAIVARHRDAAPSAICANGAEVLPEAILHCGDHVVDRYAFDLPALADASYTCDGERIAVDCDHGGDLRIAFASCNGQEHGDLDRDMDERDAMWRRMAAEHRARPFHLLLQGGDQIYADEVTATHPATADWPRRVPASLSAGERTDLSRALTAGFVRRYLATFGQPGYAWLAARVPTLAMWDDHDICDGWGSLPEDILRSAAGEVLFETARSMFLVFQMGEAQETLPRHVDDRTGASLGWTLDLPGLRIVAPDLRSERTKARIMGPVGWRGLEAAFAAPPERVLLVSSVPALGPRLSLVERVMQRTPWAEKYEDDLRDQWQSRAHREEWRRLLRLLVDMRERGTDVTVISGEIHLATRATMATAAGPVHQLVASGVAHPAPGRAYARALGTLARLGEAPLSGHPVRLHPLPGRRTIYTAERNYLVLERTTGAWSAGWELERGGRTASLAI